MLNGVVLTLKDFAEHTAIGLSQFPLTTRVQSIQLPPNTQEWLLLLNILNNFDLKVWEREQQITTTSL